MRTLRARLTYANVIAPLALFIALGGTSWAAVKITGKNVKDSFGSTSGYMGGISVVQCSIPGYETEDYYLSPNGTYVSEIESLSLNSTIDHPGGVVELRCDRVWNDAVVRQAGLTAVKVGSIG
jgi:hypothetical protein